jgi:hypothetical protein
MSTTRSGVFKFKCWFDHSLGKSCDGHMLEVEQHNTSDTVSVIIDGEQRLCVDQGTWDVLIKAIEALRLRNAGFWKEADELVQSVQP